MKDKKDALRKKTKIPREVKADRKIELEKKKPWYCFRCGAGIPSKVKRKKNKSGKVEGKCPFCKRPSVFVDYYPTAENVEKHEKVDDNLPNIPNTPNLPNQPNTPNQKHQNHLIKHFLSKVKKPYESIGRGIHDGKCYLGTYIEEDSGKTRDAVVTSDRKMYIDYWKGKNQIKDEFGLNYKDPFFADALDTWWSNSSIEKWIFDGYEVDIKEIFKKIKQLNDHFMIYEDKTIHTFVALDIIRSFFHFLFPANARTYFHADKGSGKTNQLMIYRALCFNPISSPDFSSASIYRIIESTGGSILIDDFDQLPEDQKNAIIQHIRANYKPFKTIRNDLGGRGFRPRAFNSYSPLAFNNVLGLGYDEITKDRCITIRLLKHLDARDRTVDYKDPIFSRIRDDLYCCLLQYWVEIKNIYDELKIEELSARDLELWKPFLAIAKVIGEDIYKEILAFALNFIEQESMRDLYDDWEYLLLEHLHEMVSNLNDDETIKVSVKELAEEIGIKRYGDRSSDSFKEHIYSLRSYIGNKLTSYVLFKKTKPHNCVYYHVYKKGLIQIIESKGGLGLLGGVRGGTDQAETKSLSSFKQKSDPNKSKNLSQIERIEEIKEYCVNVQEKGTNPSYTALIDHFDENTISNLIESGQLNKIPKTDCYRWGDS